MKNDLWKKEIVFGIVMLFIGASIIPNISGNEKNNDDKLIKNNIANIRKLIDRDNINIFSTSCESLNQQSSLDPPNILWNKTFGGNSGDSGYKIRKTSDNGYIVLGNSGSFSRSREDFWLLKIDKNGNEEWNHSYGSDLDEFAMDLQQTSDGGYIIVGYYFFFHSHDRGIRLVKTGSDGTELWNKTFGTEFEPADAFSVYQTTDGGYLILGNHWSSTGLYLIKTDGSGEKLWEMNIPGPGNSIWSTSSAKTDDGGYIITGFVLLDDDIDLFVMKIDSNYNKQWNSTIGGELFDGGLSVIQTENDKYVAAGVADSTNEFIDGKAWIVQFDNQGIEEWNTKIDGDKPESLFCVKETMSGYVAVGRRITSTRGDYDMLVIITDVNGDINEKWHLGGDSYDEGYCIYVTSEDDYIIVGYTMSYDTYGSSDLWLLKIEGLKINLPPNPPVIQGHTQVSKGVYYIWSFTTTDPNGDDIYLYVDWGDGDEEEWDGPHKSGEQVNISHRFQVKGNYSIRARARDVYDAEGGWSYLKVSAPKSKGILINNLIVQWLFEHFPNALSILRYILGL